MKSNEKATVKIQSYQNIWNYEKRIYTLFDMVLPTSISISEFGYFVVVELIVIAVNFVLKLPSFGEMGFLIKFAVIPYGVMRLLKYNKLDGKNPIAFFKDYIKFFLKKHKQYEFFRDVSSIPEEQDYIIHWQCSYRHRLKYLPRKRRMQH